MSLIPCALSVLIFRRAFAAVVHSQVPPISNFESLLERSVAAETEAVAEAFTPVAEANRLWQQQFQGLDESFERAKKMYIDGALSMSQSQLAQQKRVANYMKAASLLAGDARTKTSGLLRKEANEGSASADELTYGFYLHCFFEAAAVVHQLRDVRKFYPEAPVYIMSDGGANFTGICEQIGNCKFAFRANANDRWNPKPFLDRFREAAEWLHERKAAWTIFLEPDVTLNKRASYAPTADAGGLYDMWNPTMPLQLLNRMTELGRKFSGNQQFTLRWDHFGLAGGSIIRTRAAMISFKPEHINWPEMESLWNECIYSSDVAMLIALASHGFSYYPWEDVHQDHDEYQPKHVTAFQHHSANEGKPHYGEPLAPEDSALVTPPPDNARGLLLGMCQHCVWSSEAECYHDNIILCNTDQQSFRNVEWKGEDPNPGLWRWALEAD